MLGVEVSQLLLVGVDNGAIDSLMLAGSEALVLVLVVVALLLPCSALARVLVVE